jgi:hypothetical protein
MLNFCAMRALPVGTDERRAMAIDRWGAERASELTWQHRLVRRRARVRVLASACAIALACAPAFAAQEPVPLPPVRPPDLAPPAQESAAPQPTADDNADLRAQVLASRHVIGEALSLINEAGGCGIAAPLRVEAILLADGRKVALSPPAAMRAALAAALADWVREDLAPAIAKGDRLAGIEGVGGYECRGRNRLPGAQLSEHAKGNALDLQGFLTERGKHLTIGAPKSPGDDDAFFALMKKTACLRFATVLGPGSDPFHAQHLHIDLAARAHGTRLCQWSLPDARALGASEANR